MNLQKQKKGRRQVDNYAKKEVPGENGTQGMDAQFQTMKMDVSTYGLYRLHLFLQQ